MPQVKDIVATYKTLAKIPNIVSARLNNAVNKITSKWSIRDLDKGKVTKYNYDYILDNDLKTIAESNFGSDVSKELLSTISPSGKYKAIIREEKDSKDVKKQYLEIWQAYTKQTIDLKALDIHGDVYADAEFGCLDWSPDETAVVYVAEKKLSKVESYIKRNPVKDLSTDKSKDDSAPKVGEEHVYRQDWGEQLVGKHLSVIVVCNVEDQTFNILEGLPESWCPGQVHFAPNGGTVVGVAWETEPRRLGLVFCTNRPSSIFSLTYEGPKTKQMRKISGPGLSVRSPRFSPRGDRLVWLQRATDGPHHACHALAAAAWPPRELDVDRGDESESVNVSLVVDIVATEVKTANGKSFYGIYGPSLPSRCFSEDGKKIVFSTPQKMEIRSYLVGVDDGHLLDISNPSFNGSTTVLDVKNDTIVAVCSNMNTPSQLFITRVSEAGGEKARWQRVSNPLDVPEPLSRAIPHLMELEHEDSKDEIKSFSAIYFAPAVEEGKKFPLVVWPHGGPHSNLMNMFTLEAALFNLSGFAVVQINYRGSTGSGDASLNYLLGRIGEADVIDCYKATQECLRLYPVDPKKIGLFGGSHGGFLVTQLSGQYPDVYAAVVSRNPVIDCASMVNSSDIPDWCAVEAGYTFTQRGPVSEEQLLKMRRCSPMAHIHRVTAPTALMLGLGDKRVPPCQGLEYYHRLKANGCKVKVYMYDDNHSLSSLPNEADNLINGVAWLVEHINTDK